MPNLATSYDYPAGAKHIAVNLRKGVKFQDGTPFDAAAFKWTIENAQKTYSMPGGSNMTSMEIIDASTLRINLIEHNSMVPFNLWRPTFYSPTATQKNGQDWAVINSISTAAYTKAVDWTGWTIWDDWISPH